MNFGKIIYLSFFLTFFTVSSAYGEFNQTGDYTIEGKVGIGTDSPQSKLDVKGSIKFGQSINDWRLDTESFTNGLSITKHNSGVYEVFFGNNGNVGIGTTSPENKLDVKGTIRAEEVKVETGWSDFVFDNRYNLPDLEQVESYIKDNKHLPEIPSAKEIEEEGLSMAKMMSKQMQKIEELTLYVIEQNKEIKELKKKLAELEERK